MRILVLCVLLTGCSITEEAIQNRDLYCSEIYQGARAVARAGANLVLGTGGVPDVCETLDEVIEADAATKSDQES